ncbi:crossover junction endonuclease MUS81 [Sodiomyces alkalinus F11]|uniref:Crossover junction endonuclease MUS81 n=1 Tax=Sodiomyces alkalinus (strain CBS 110278 / VKM F-3762 / F11) TaxID=1314773 RepID=A0A3N2PZ57_SODAK|nr:crossover junction endonuclease MUS81 [Sodiomyces alkalinus F11]ROT39811.1 crossover junction endonuclease MUS81 [Sodiomyces alkalinus F11]
MSEVRCRLGGEWYHDQFSNPLLLDWLKKWLDQARERSTKGVVAYKTAYESLKACPITFTHPQQLRQLRGFGDKLCARLTDQMKKHCEQNGLAMPRRPGLSKEARASLSALTASGTANTADDTTATGGPSRKARKPKSYVPAYRSGAYALVLALSTLEEGSRTGLTKNELIEIAQDHCDSSFTAPSDTTKFYTAWNSMKTLLDKDLVYEKGRPMRRYFLTEEGWEVAKRIKQSLSSSTREPGASESTAAGSARAADVVPRAPSPAPPNEKERSPSVEPMDPPPPKPSFHNVVVDGTDDATEDGALPNFSPIRLAPGTFTVHLLLDVREVRAKTDRDYIQDELAKKGVKPIVRALEVGDVQWVAKTHDPAALTRHGAEGDEVVLDWIVERKRLDDLISSIKDGRFQEQKFRLRRAGVKNVIYVVEEISMDSTYFQKYEESVQSALASMQVVNGYFVKKTQKMDDTIRYLARMTSMLRKLYEEKPLLVIPTKVLTAQNYLPLLRHLRETQPDRDYHITYPAFASLASKSDMMTLRDVFLKMLMTTRGVTGEKALEIQKRWKTPYELVKAFEACGSGEQGLKRKREMISNGLPSMVARKKIPKAVSQKLSEVWGDTSVRNCLRFGETLQSETV